MDTQHGSRNIPPRKIPTLKIPTHQTPPGKFPPEKSHPENPHLEYSHLFHSLSFFTISSLNTSSINGGRMYMFILKDEKILYVQNGSMFLLEKKIVIISVNLRCLATDFHHETYRL